VTAPNVLLILSDDQRFDFLDYMPNTRNLVAFQGRDFVHARCNVAVCEPTRVSLMTTATPSGPGCKLRATGPA
jgi:arylsulfatase A-like enzyme